MTDRLTNPDSTPDPLDEPITLRQLAEIAAKDLGSKRPLHISTVRAWANPNKGKMGVVLQTFIRLGMRMTTRRLYQEFDAKVACALEDNREVMRQRAQNARDRAEEVRILRQQTARAQLQSVNA